MTKNNLIISRVTGRVGFVLSLDYNGIHKVYVFAYDSYEYLQHKEMKIYNEYL